MRCAVIIVLVALAGCSANASSAERGGERLVTIGGALTEIVFALGKGDAVVGADTSSTYPPEAARLPRVGSHRRVSAEAVLALRPTHVIASSDTPGAALDQIRGAGIQVTLVEEVTTGAGAAARIRTVGHALDLRREGDELATGFLAELDAAAAPGARPRVMFIYARGTNVLQVAGRGTPAHAIIQLAGGVNAAAELDGFRPLSAESAVAARPDVILMMSTGVASVEGDGGVFALPGIALTPAGRERRLIEMDGLLLLGFGPRLPVAVRQLAAALARIPAEPAP